MITRFINNNYVPFPKSTVNCRVAGVRHVPIALALVAIAGLASLGQSKPDRQERRDVVDVCLASLSGFPKDALAASPPPYPSDLTGVTLKYFASGCYGRCPAFTLTIQKDAAIFEGHAYVRAKGKRRAKISPKQFESFLRAWFDGRFFAMRDDYCSVTCPDGTVIVVTDIPESSITLKTPAFTKQVYQCFATSDGKPHTPKPPDQYFDLSRQLQAFAQAQHWL